MESPKTCSLTSHHAIMKCPWQWRQPFLAEKLESRKRKVGDGYFYDPVDPSFVDHLLPGHAKKFCDALLESDEKEKIQREIERLQSKKQEEESDQGLLLYDSLVFTNGENDSAKEEHENSESTKSENQALVDSILRISKAVEEASLLVSPFNSSDEDDASGASGDELVASPAASLDLVSDNLNLAEDFFSTNEEDMLA